MPEIQTSLHGRKLGLSEAGRLLVNPPDDVNGPFAVPYIAANAVATSTTLTNSTAETAFSNGAYTIPANSLRAGHLIRVRFQGIAMTTNSTDTLTIKLYLGGLGGTALLAAAATDVTNSDVFQGEYELAIRTAGSSGTVVGTGTYKVPSAEGTMTIKDDILASTAIDTTTSQDVTVTGKWSVASTNDTCRLDFFRVEIA